MNAAQSGRAPAWLLALAAVVIVVLVWSGIKPYDRVTWIMETLPVMIALPLLAATYQRFPLTPLVSWLIALHCCVLCLGGAYTYARVPLGFWMQDVLSLSRNPYDKIGHVMQGFVPAMIARELLLRLTPLKKGGWLFVIVTSVCLAISAIYELIEWAAALALGQGADEFLGTQGDPWDTQSDMFCALIGAIAAQLLLSRWHDRQLASLSATSREDRSAA